MRSGTRLASGTEAPKRRTPLESLALAWLAMIPIVGGVGASAVLGRVSGDAVAGATAGWAGAVLCFLSGVRRGLAFAQRGGPTVRQLGEMLLIFTLGAGGVLSRARGPALVSLATGYAAVGVLDPMAADAGEAPRYFARLRPWQMAVPVASLLLLLAREVRGGGRSRL